MKGIFITMEGPDGSGKSTQIELLKEFLTQKGYEILVTRDPGGTAVSEAIREIILNKEFSEMNDMTELLLYAAARAQLVGQVIKPALAAGKAVISDRFVDSAAVYQGIARGLGIDTVYDINRYALQGIMPDMTFHLDLPAEVGIARKKNQAELDRMELQTIEFHQKVAQGYRELAKRNPERIITIDATLPKEEICDMIRTRVNAVLE
jgi:dTMP kinase